MSDLTDNKHYAKLLLGLNERFGSELAGPEPDIEHLRSIIKDAVSTKNPFSESDEKVDRHLAPRSFIDSPRAESGKILYAKNSGYDYRKGEKPVYGRNDAEMDEAQILERLNLLLNKNEISGLGSAEMAEVKELQKKVR